MRTITMPTPGRIVLYQTDGRNYDYALPAIVTITEDNLVPEAVAAGVIAPLSSAGHVHLWVPGGSAPYYEYDVPPGNEDHPCSWRYPEHTARILEVPVPQPVIREGHRVVFRGDEGKYPIHHWLGRKGTVTSVGEGDFPVAVALEGGGGIVCRETELEVLP